MAGGTMPAPRRDRAAGFTLIELTVVLALMAALVSVAIVSFRATCERARLRFAIEEIAAADQHLRDQAARFGRGVQLTIDLDRHRLTMHTLDGEGKPVDRAAALSRVRLDGIYVRSALARYGVHHIAFSSSGSPSYAIGLRAASGAARWLLVCGATGQTITIDAEREIKTVFQEMFSKRLDAD